MSVFPVIAITEPVFSEKLFANATALSRFSSVKQSAISASTPFAEPVPSANVLISEMLPRITEKCMLSRSLNAVSVLKCDAPTPTGSKTTGWQSSLAFLPAASIEEIVRELSVPMFMQSPSHADVISAASLSSSAIIGDAPHAKSIFAQSLTVTKFVIL